MSSRAKQPAERLLPWLLSDLPTCRSLPILACILLLSGSVCEFVAVSTATAAAFSVWHHPHYLSSWHLSGPPVHARYPSRGIKCPSGIHIWRAIASEGFRL